MESELELIEKLKTLCDQKGVEKQPQESAVILHKLGKIYRQKSPDMLSLIRSAALFAGAKLRKPANLDEVNDDLNELCLHLLQLSDCTDKNASLMDISEEVSQKIQSLRKQTAVELQAFSCIERMDTKSSQICLERQRISAVRKLLGTITQEYVSIMRFIAQKVLDIIGVPPYSTKFAIVGLGSLARGEITPYSDFEHVIVLNDDVIKREGSETVIQFFKWFSVLFHVVIIGLCETIIPCVAVPTLNNSSSKHLWWFYDAKTPRGIALDGFLPHACKLPIGRQQGTTLKPWKTELIKPVSEMLKYLEIEQDLKNGYNLADVLSRPCFIFGSKDVYDKYAHKAGEIRRLNDFKNNFKDFERILERDLKYNSTETHVKNAIFSGKYVVKQLVYQGIVLFVAGLGRFYGVEGLSSFQILDDLNSQGVLDHETIHCLEYAVAVACQLRLKLYSDQGKQNDYITAFGGQLVFEKLISAIGLYSLTEYFNTAMTLQKQLKNDFRKPVSIKHSSARLTNGMLMHKVHI